MPANTSAVAFTPPTICTTMAKIAAYFHVPRLSGARSARMVSASIHGSPAHGSRITEMRDEKSSVYGVSMNSDGGDDRTGTAHVQRPQQEQHAERGAEQDRAEPQPLRHPGGHAGQVQDPVVRAHREEVADVLVGDRPHPDVGIPHRHRPLEQAAGIEVEVALGVGDDLAGLGEQHRHVGEQRQERVPEAPQSTDAAVRARPRRSSSWSGDARRGSRPRPVAPPVPAGVPTSGPRPPPRGPPGSPPRGCGSG